ncbi:hypothetical protein BZA05DRAFT_451453, partial [Tricharina praecox]|uniref:uncharacterized protein n=1 Tax=Tricharina praecox TaxID=43433 RepID=UPI002220BA2E
PLFLPHSSFRSSLTSPFKIQKSTHSHLPSPPTKSSSFATFDDYDQIMPVTTADQGAEEPSRKSVNQMSPSRHHTLLALPPSPFSTPVKKSVNQAGPSSSSDRYLPPLPLSPDSESSKKSINQTSPSSHHTLPALPPSPFLPSEDSTAVEGASEPGTGTESTYQGSSSRYNPIPMLRSLQAVPRGNPKDPNFNSIFEFRYKCDHHTLEFYKAPLNLRYYTHQLCPDCERKRLDHSPVHKILTAIFGTWWTGPEPKNQKPLAHGRGNKGKGKDNNETQGSGQGNNGGEDRTGGGTLNWARGA